MDDLSQFFQGYLTECYELLADMEERLMQLEDGSVDLDSLNAIFRDAHSIKGGAGAFGLVNISNFTHVQETLLDQLREETVTARREIIDVLLKSRDVVYQMLVAAQESRELPADYGQDIRNELERFIAETDAALVASPKAGTGKDNTRPVMPNQPTTYEIVFRPKETLLTHGNEPILLLRELATLGEVEIQCDASAIPTLDAFDPALCYLSWTTRLHTGSSRAEIEEVFEFASDDCTLEIRCADEHTATTPPDNEAPPASVAVAAAAPEKAAVQNQQPAPPKQPAGPVSTSIRVDIDKVDALINMVGEVVITQAMLVSQTQQLQRKEFIDLINGVEELSQHTRELQEAVMAIRMQPVKSVFSRLPRMVRDLSDKLGKDVHLTMQGEQTEVDKTIIEQLSDPLTHLIRNAIDHGVETPDIREANGKPRGGEVVLSAEHSGGRIVIQIRDDGQGINREKVLEKAKEKGVVAPDAQLSAAEIDQLIFAPGFSTAAELSDVSGRGVGMDVVKQNIEQIGGTVGVKSTPGKGSIFTITLPLTLAILDGMIVRVGSEYYIIPIADILETRRPSAEEIHEMIGGMRVLNVRGSFHPLLYLHQFFDIDDGQTDASEALVVMVENGRNRLGIVVDELLGQQQVVIKSLEDNADPIEGVSGATILGDGNVSLILDIGHLCRINGESNDNASQQVA